MRKKLISVLMGAVMTFGCVACNAGSPADLPDENQNSAAQTSDDYGQLEILKADYNFTPEEKFSQIKAEYLIENQGYSDDDEIVAILALPDNSLMDTYLEEESSAQTVADFATTADGVLISQKLAKKQSNLINTLYNMGLISGVKYTYSTITNAVAVTTTYGNFKKIEENYTGGLISRAVLSDTFSHPQAAQSEGGLVENTVNVYETGIYNSESVNDLGYSGQGTSVAVLDSGFDISHSVFQISDEDMQPGKDGEYVVSREDVERVIAEAKQALNSADYQEGVATEKRDGHTKSPKLLLNDVMNAVEATPGLIADNVYHGLKIPFAYDYADRDYDVFPYDSEHGTHVAGIIGGYSEEGYLDKDGNRVVDADGNPIPFRGVAKNTQLVLMKVFPDLQSGAQQDDILAALEDAVILNVDAINMSLGISCGFAREPDGDFINDVYDKINESGISLVTAASNSFSSGYGGEQGNTSFVTNPDNGTVGTPSTYEGALSVASISGKKSRYMLANGSQIVYFHESNSISGKENDFFGELFSDVQTKGSKYQFTDKEYKDRYDGLQVAADGTLTLEYVTVPGVGNRGNYNNINVKGKIALVRRGDNSFEDKALQAKTAGAIGCVIYNNVEGDILMSMGKTDHIPTVSISKDVGTTLASKDSGTITISYSNEAGPFMSDFSSWGPMPDLGLKPEITAHGGNILSAVPGGGFEELSGTSMASPNMCGVVVLIRQYLKQKYSDSTWKQISVMTNQILMSTATIALNEEGNPYSPRKQGAGLASLSNVVNTKGYITVDGKDRTKIELGDDAKRNGVYEMDFNVVNMSDNKLQYDISLVAMSESVSTSDITHIAERGYLLSDKITATATEGGSISGTTLTVEGNGTAKVHVVYTLTQEDRDYIESHFPYGHYVEGFVKLALKSDGDTDATNNVDLNVPFLAFYGDWTQAPIFDKTYYEVESQAHNMGIDEEDKIKADYYATRPLGSYYYNYIIPLGTYLYQVDTNQYDEIPASLDHIALSDLLGSIDGITAVYAGLLRDAKFMYYTITDKVSGKVIWEYTDKNVIKAFSEGGSPVPSYEQIRISSADLQLINNRVYEFKMEARLDYGDGGVANNVRNSFEFDFTFDNQAPVLRGATYEKIYDKTLKKDRYYINLTVYDNHYVQSVYPMIFNRADGNYVRQSYLTDYPIPVYSDKGQDNVVRFEITDMLEDAIYADYLDGYLAFSVDDYAMNTNFYFVQLPGANGSLKFTKDGTAEGDPLTVKDIRPGEVLDLTQYLVSTDNTTYTDRDFLKTLTWTSSDESVIKVAEGQAMGIKASSNFVQVTATSSINRTSATLRMRVRADAAASATALASHKAVVMADRNVPNVDDARIESVRFAYFTTLYAHLASGGYSDIGQTGDSHFVNGVGGGVEMYPGESIQLFYDIDPWYVADKYTPVFTSSNTEVATVDPQTGVVKTLKEGNARIVVQFGSYDQSGKFVSQTNLQARFNITVNSEFIIENRILTAYKGLGGKVVIPDDEGIMYIGPYAFCQYTTDPEIQVDEDDWYRNYIPGENSTVTSVTIPKGVMEIQRNAFQNCYALEEVIIDDPDGDLKFIRENAFNACFSLAHINLDKVQAIGASAFEECGQLKSVDLSMCYSLGARAFANSGLTSVDISHLRNASAEVFAECQNLNSVTLNSEGNTKLSEGMFKDSALAQISAINCKTGIPAHCFENCVNLKSVDIATPESASQMGSYAFYGCTGLSEITLPDWSVSYGTEVFGGCSKLATVKLRANTLLNGGTRLFVGAAVTKFELVGQSEHYAVAEEGRYLTDKAGTTLILAAPAYSYGDLTLDYATIGDSAFAGANVSSVVLTNKDVKVGAYAFADCANLATVTFPTEAGATVGDYAFAAFNRGQLVSSALQNIENLEKVTYIGSYAFAGSLVTSVNIGSGAELAASAFLASEVNSLTVGSGAKLGTSAFAYCTALSSVEMPAEGGVTLGEYCFYNATNLNSIDLSKVSQIPAFAFANCSKLRTVDLSQATAIGEAAFYGCGLTSVQNVNMLVSIGDHAFQQNNFAQITLPASLKTIGAYAFADNVMANVTIPEGVNFLGGYAFACLGENPAARGKLKTVSLPSTLKNIGEYSFAGNTGLTTVNLQYVEVVGEGAFAGDQSLTAADLAAAVRVEAFAFNGAAALRTVVANNLEFVGESAFDTTGLTSFTAPKLAYISVYAFADTSLVSFTFSDKLEFIDTGAFIGSMALAHFYTPDNQAEGQISEYARLVGGVLYTAMDNGKLLLNAVPGGMTFEDGKFEVQENTYRVGFYAANANPNITMVVLPDSLAAIENFAFYGCANLETVEFRSAVAPILESYTVAEDSTLSPNDPGYGFLHGAFEFSDMFTTLYNYNFVDLLGKNEPLNMIVPSNSDIEGYDALPYTVYFGGVANAEKSNYVAMEKNMRLFMEYATRVSQLQAVTLANENLVMSALTAYNAIKRPSSYKDYGISKEEWDGLVNCVNDARDKINAIKVANMSKTARDIQDRINALPDAFDGSETQRQTYLQLTDDINSLRIKSDIDALDLTRYNQFKASYDSYSANPGGPGGTGDNENPGGPADPEPAPGCGGCGSTTIDGGAAMGGLVLLTVMVMLATTHVLRRRTFKRNK